MATSALPAQLRAVRRSHDKALKQLLSSRDRLQGTIRKLQVAGKGRRNEPDDINASQLLKLYTTLGIANDKIDALVKAIREIDAESSTERVDQDWTQIEEKDETPPG